MAKIYHPKKPTWQWTITIFKYRLRYTSSDWLVFNCQVSCRWYRYTQYLSWTSRVPQIVSLYRPDYMEDFHSWPLRNIWGFFWFFARCISCTCENAKWYQQYQGVPNIKARKLEDIYFGRSDLPAELVGSDRKEEVMGERVEFEARPEGLMDVDGLLMVSIPEKLTNVP